MRIFDDIHYNKPYMEHGICFLTSAFSVRSLLMYIRNLEEGAELPKHLIYGAALIHDIGRFIQNDKGIPHNEAGADIAEVILPECGYSEAESVLIAEAVREHRRGSDSTLGKYLYDADKQSRCCFSCDARKECNWPDEKKNLKITE